MTTLSAFSSHHRQSSYQLSWVDPDGFMLTFQARLAIGQSSSDLLRNDLGYPESRLPLHESSSNLSMLGNNSAIWWY